MRPSTSMALSGARPAAVLMPRRSWHGLTLTANFLRKHSRNQARALAWTRHHDTRSMQLPITQCCCLHWHLGVCIASLQMQQLHAAESASTTSTLSNMAHANSLLRR